MSNELMLILKSFGISNKSIDCVPLGNGHINSTFLCSVDSNKKYVLQKINNYVFKDVDLLMSNYYKVTNYLYQNKIETIHVIKMKKDMKVQIKYLNLLVFISPTL